MTELTMSGLFCLAGVSSRRRRCCWPRETNLRARTLVSSVPNPVARAAAISLRNASLAAAESDAGVDAAGEGDGIKSRIESGRVSTVIRSSMSANNS